MTPTTSKNSTMLASKLTVPLFLVGSLLSAALGAGAVAGVARDKLDATVVKTERLDTVREQQTLELQEVKLRLGLVEKNQDRQNAALERIEQKLGTR